MSLIYCLEDDHNIREMVIYALKASGFSAQGFESADGFYKAVSLQTPNLAILDIMLPGENGISVLKKIRASKVTKKLPIIMLTAKSDEYDKVTGLDNGADDYITKPFGIMELISRIKALLRRVEDDNNIQEVYYAKNITLNVEKHTVFDKDKKISLTLKEFDLLYQLMKNRGIVLSRDRLLSIVWNMDFEGETRTVDVHVKSIRQKLGDSGNIIETVRGVGYKIGDSKE